MAAEVRAEMARQRITPAQLADATDISRATLGRRLSGQYSFTVEELGSIAEYLDMNPQVFIERARTEEVA